MILKLIFLFVIILLRIAFITLFERKILGSLQLRHGPVHTGFAGLLQPISDGIKLFTTEFIISFKVKRFGYIISPAIMLTATIILWLAYFSKFSISRISLISIFTICCFSARVYYTLGASWASSSKYATLGGMRAVAQTISYEVSFFLILLSVILLVTRFEFSIFNKFSPLWIFFLAIPLAVIWFISGLAETGRTPFDFAEGESELVSGFNTEFGSGPFAIFSLAEYGTIIFVRFLFVLFFCGGNASITAFLIKFSILIIIFVWVRGALPRLRYDLLINLAWFVFLPVALRFLLFYASLKNFIL